MKNYDPSGELGPSKPIPDAVAIAEPKEEQPIETHSEHRNGTQPAPVYEQASQEVAPEAQAEQTPAQTQDEPAAAAESW
jgi:hypothetical protein